MQRQTPSCTARFSISAGDTMSLTTPNFPNHYDRLLSCLWTISAPDNVIINVDFLSFETEARYDVMSAGHGLGPETGSTVISRHSGGELPMSFSGSRNVWISFASDGSVEAYGFTANITAYQEPSEASVVSTNSVSTQAPTVIETTMRRQTSNCTRRFNLTAGDTMSLTTPNFPNNYDSLLRCLWTISAPDNVIIRVAFLSFQTETLYDVMSAGIGLGPETGRTVISRHSGDELPMSFSWPSNVWISFTSDGSVEDVGFSARISAYLESTAASPVTEATGQNSDCNRRFDLSAGRTLILTTPNFPNYYDSLLNCLWTISVPDDVIINVNFRSFETEAAYDVLSAGLGLEPETGSTVISRHSGDELPSSFSGSPSIWIRFTSDGSIEGLGFSANISAYQASTQASTVIETTMQRQSPSCTARFSISAGNTMSLTTPNFPNHYDRLVSCLWTISAPDNVIINVDFLSFETEARYDVMSAGHGLGPETGSTVISRHSGGELPMSFSGSRNVWISFASDGSVEAYGFTANVTAYQEPSEASVVSTNSAADIALFAERKTFAEAQTSCLENGMVLFKVPSESVHTELVSLLNSLGYSNIDVWINGYQRSENTWITTDGDDLTGYNLWAPGEPNGSGRCLQLWAALGHRWDDTPCSMMKAYICQSADSITSISPPNRLSSNSYPGTHVPPSYLPSVSSKLPEGLVQWLSPATSVVIESPNYPNPYDNNLERTWAVSTAEGYMLHNSFSSFDTEDKYDTLTVWEGLSPEDGIRLFQFSGSNLPNDFTVMSSSMHITFKSDFSVNRPGFQLTITSVQD
ncbi:CUB and sushi domain-containing protein 1-like [Ptychodera flava]|uniref:CUB and sushi domain-containing protein 1-like n=1 Tax=Ptychodera flava TaxID=63121 RepID=UPI00396A53C9